MISHMDIRNVASYGDSKQTLEDLALVNFVYGENGCGKSTIARCLNNAEDSDFNECLLEWKGAPARTLVYNSEFVENTLKETKVKGVFTFGEGASERYDRLQELVSKRQKETDKQASLKRILAEKKEGLVKLNTELAEECWKSYKAHLDEFAPVFRGAQRKNLFKDKCREHLSVDVEEGAEELAGQIHTFFTSQPAIISSVPVVSADVLRNLVRLECAAVLQQVIVGKQDVPIAALINKVGSSDWVKKGLAFQTGEVCPFCQQELPAALKAELESYFDEAYESQIRELKACADGYRTTSNHVQGWLDSLESVSNEFFDSADLKEAIAIVRQKIDHNKALLSHKLNEPSSRCDLGSTVEGIEKIIQFVVESNIKIATFNERTKNVAKEKAVLSQKVWAFVAKGLKDVFGRISLEEDKLNKAIMGIAKTYKAHEERIKEWSAEIREIEGEITSTRPSIEAINSLLDSFGFTGFKLAEADAGSKYYKIIRSDGKPVGQTLSEGERTFITFLYFYQIVQGSTSSEEVTASRIVVFDDPVSSLDSKILFIVSALIRRLFCKKSMEKLQIEQIFILTHNVYFHKEVSFMSSLKHIGDDMITSRDVAFWIVHKSGGISRLTRYTENPIKTSYQLLWKEVQNCKESPDPNINICNTLRRILENYFRMVGGIKLDELVDCFEGQEQIACRSLLSWIHDGSHSIYDDIELGVGNDLKEFYLPVFEKVFRATDHYAHYEMMMSA